MPYMNYVEYDGEFYPDWNHHLDLTKKRTSHRNDLKTDNATPDFTIKLKVLEVEKLLNIKIRYTKNWNEYKVYTFGALQTYIDDAKRQKCNYIIISKNEFAAINKDRK